MASGFFGGIIVGTVVSGLVIGAVSVLAGLPTARQPEAAVLEIPVGSEFNLPRVDSWAELPGAETTPESGKVTQADAQADAPVPDDLNAVNSEATHPAAQPDTGTSASGLILPVDIEEYVGFEGISATDGPVLHNMVVAAPIVPETDAVLIATLPALEESQIVVADSLQQIWPQHIWSEQSVNMHKKTAVILAELLELPQGPAAENWDLLIPQDSVALNIPKSAPAQPMLQQILVTGPTLTLDKTASNSAQIEVATPLVPTIPGVERGHDLAPDMEITDAAASGGQTSTLEVALEGTVPGGQNAQNAQDDGLHDGLPKSGGFENLAPDVKTNRLPSVTNTPTSVEDNPKAETVQGAETDRLPQLERYAAEFENPDGKPLMAIVLIDDGTSQIGLDELKNFPYPLSFAIDTKWPRAPQAMRAYRDAGFEVLAMADLPKGAGAADTEVTMAIYLRAVPEAVAVMEGVGEGLQSGRKSSAQLAQILAASGLGAVMLPKGLNTAQKLIAREGVPAITVFRDFDSKGQSAETIKCYLDRAVLKAGQVENGVIMVGRLRDETINALVVWALEDRAARVALAPVSAVLRGE